MTISLPYKPAALFHRHGGKIIEVLGIDHVCAAPRDGYSRDRWFYRCRVEWDDGSHKHGTTYEVEPVLMVYENDEGRREVCALDELLSAYLNQHGEWREVKPKGWRATSRGGVR